MSEENNVDLNNLCITEDAFENFQANSVIEEEEYITLSDIVSPELSAAQNNSDFTEIPYDNEVVLTSNLDEQFHDYGSGPIDIEINPPVPDPVIIDSNNVNIEMPTVQQTDQNVQGLTTKPKRGRRKKTCNTDITENPEIVQNNSQEIDSSISNPRPKRGRKPNRHFLAQDETKLSNVRQSVPKKRGRKSNSEKIASNLSSEPQAPKRVAGKRGRPKKTSLDANMQAPLDQTATDEETTINESHDNGVSEDTSLKNLEKSHRRRGRRPKKAKIEQQFSDSDIPTNSEILDTASHSNGETMKSPGKRGRSKKELVVKVEEVALQYETTSQLSDNEDELDSLPLTTFSSQHTNGNSIDIQQIDTNQQISKQLDDIDDEADLDNVSLSKIKETQEIINENPTVEIEDNITLEKTSVPTDSTPNTDINLDPVQNDTITDNKANENNSFDDSLLVEDPTKRPRRIKAKKTFHYEDDSDEDPFANVELSDDEPIGKRRGKRYYSDDEYVPGLKEKADISSEPSESEIDEAFEETKPKRKRFTKKSESTSPKKQPKTDSINVTTIEPTIIDDPDDIEVCLQSSVIQTGEDSNVKLGWGASSEFENFIAKKIQGTDLKIKKVSSNDCSQNAPLEIPVLNPDAKKTIEMCTQTATVETTSVKVQTTTPYEVPMKKNVALSTEQSQKACEFLKNIVKTTSELGHLMTQKSEDFITKKINTTHVVDTFKMDYCVKKSFLLLKLAKHNIVQMEEDLSKQYEDFLKSTNLSCHREEPKTLVPTEKDNDSDCEIVEEPTQAKSSKPKFNPKTVFLNKELSIKIAKKPTAKPEPQNRKNNINIKNKSTVWISDSVMVKKVKPTQSFLAQDSRNKKPPDCYVTQKMVSDFFKAYYKKLTPLICAPFTSPVWLAANRKIECNYFFVKSDRDFSAPSSSFSENNDSCLDSNANTTTAISNTNKSLKFVTEENFLYNPKSLFSLCTEKLKKHMKFFSIVTEGSFVQITATFKDVEQSPMKLFRLCLNVLNDKSAHKLKNSTLVSSSYIEEARNKVMSLKTLCYRKVSKIFQQAETSLTCFIETDNDFLESQIDDLLLELENNKVETKIQESNEVETLFALCVKHIQAEQSIPNKLLEESVLSSVTLKNSLSAPKSLQKITLDNIKDLLGMKNEDDNCFAVPKTVYKVKKLTDICFEMISAYTAEGGDSAHSTEKMSVGLTINSINTMSEEAFHNMEEDNIESEVYDEDEFDGEFNDYEPDDEQEENSWVSQLQMQELRSCSMPNDINNVANTPETDDINNVANTPETDDINNVANTPETDDINNVANTPETDSTNILLENIVTARVKIEPADDPVETLVDSAIVKPEPIQNFDEMTVIPESIITKQEKFDENRELIPNSYDVENFEKFVRRNKMMTFLEEPDYDIFSQSGLRVRRQHEPDYNNEYDPAMGLLVPQMFEPLNVETAKGRLMESSSDEETSNKKVLGKKKPDRRGKNKKIKKLDPKPQDREPQVLKEKPSAVLATSEVAILTRRMREKIRQEEKKIASSESEDEGVSIRKDKERKEIDRSKSPARKEKEQKENDKPKSLKSSKPSEDEIQCNNVDSTEQIDFDSFEKDKNFTGFSAVDQNEFTSYQKYVKYVYDKIITEDENSSAGRSENLATNVARSSKQTENDDRSNSPLIDYEDPVEMLECEPTLPMFDDESVPNAKKNIKNKGKRKLESKNNLEPVSKEVVKEDKPIFRERDGWECYPIGVKETKLYQNARIVLEKLPEAFVETYFRYQEVTDKNKEDQEVDKLINLNSLNRLTTKDGKSKNKGKIHINEQTGKANDSSVAATFNYESGDSLTASDDDGANADDEVPPLAPGQSCENNLAKSSLMNESDSEEGVSKVKQELKDDSFDSNKSRKKKLISDIPNSGHSESLMLTADKMMNKELNLLHAPVVLGNDITGMDIKESVTRTKHKNSSKSSSSRGRTRNDEDSSSEEEKQWVTTKEKLLKRIGKKSDTSTADDAKRAKLVSEFIERRGDAQVGNSRKRGKGRRGRKRNTRKRLEREKQIRVLSHELFGEPIDPAMMGPRHTQVSQSYFKGRRNIRKVLDKKSLQRSTVIANMEEFERKRRLIQQQARLRELLGYEEDVSVLVINDEVCLEYGFEEERPLVSVHPFFTKVMKAHQYEGVKFMWDACFESLEQVEAGHPGGGCILAHCMGLGKTLQVLALLHTVLTHPRVGMQRVLVCCPLSTVLNWVDEIHKWIGPVTNQIKVFELSKLKKTYERAYQLEDWYTEGGIFIIGYELFRSLTTLDPELDDIRPTIVNKIRTALLEPGPDIVVCDEGHLLKNDSSVLAVAMSRVATKRRIVLTGTPMQNNLREYYCMVNFVKPNLLGTYSEYSNRFENPIMNGQHRDSQEEDIKLMKQRTHILHKVLEGCLQRQEVSVLYPYLPKKHEYTVFISLTSVQWDLYKHYLENYCPKQTKQSVLKDFHMLQKIWSHPQVLHNFQMKSRDDSGNRLKVEKLEDDLAHEDLKAEDIKPLDTETWWLQYLDGGSELDCLDSSNKFVAVFKILEECVALGDKVLLFSTSLITLDAMEFFLKKINKWSLGHDYYRLDGSVPAEVRQKWCREFNAEHNLVTKLFLISTRAGCLGLNMVAANRVILFDTSWNPAHDIQSIFRVYRFGQKKDCYIYRLVALGTMEQKIYERSVTKQAVACRVVDEQQIDRHYNMAELTELYRYDESGVSVSCGVAVGVHDVVLLRVARLAALHAVHEHDSLLRGSGEQALPEHERLAVWNQFQQEHATKQLQNHLVPYATKVYGPSKKQMEIQMPPQDAVKTETVSEENLTETHPQNTKKKKKKKGGSVKNEPGPQQPPAKLPADNDPEEQMVKQIMELLVQHNFQGRPEEISALVANVRIMVATGVVPEGTFSKDLAKSIATVIIANEKTNNDKTNSDDKKKRGRPKRSKQAVPDIIKPSTSQIPQEDISPEQYGRRRAALNAEKQIDSITNNIVEFDGDDYWQNEDTQSGDDEWLSPALPPKQKKASPAAKHPTHDAIKKEPDMITPTVIDSIVLSDDDDDEPLQKIQKQTTIDKKVKPTDPSKESKPSTSTANSEAIPLHPSLLSNKNFTKIVAHTYLEGNPLLDEDAAMLAAQYTVMRAKREIESTGKHITSGPIYDIALKILGPGILEKLHMAKPVAQVDPPPEPVVINPPPEPVVINPPPEPVVINPPPEPVVIDPPPEPVVMDSPPEPESRVSARRSVKLANIAEPAPPAKPSRKSASKRDLKRIASTDVFSQNIGRPTVVPVGLINRTGSIANESITQDLEESILPDDDVSPGPSAPTVIIKPHSIFKAGAKALLKTTILTAAVEKTKTSTSSIPTTNIPTTQPHIPKLVISAGKLLPQCNMMTSTPKQHTKMVSSLPAPVTASQEQPLNTICLDSDEEEIIIPNIEAPKRRVALKSTAKPATGPVPVSLRAANPLLNSMLPQPTITPDISSIIPTVSEISDSQFAMQNQSQQMPVNIDLNGKKYLMIPASHVQKLMTTTPPVNQNILPQNPPQSIPPLLNSTMLPQMPNVMNVPSESSTGSSKTLCKPGDILRVTDSGKVEILNRASDAITVIDDDVPSTSTDQPLLKRSLRKQDLKTMSNVAPMPPKAAPTPPKAAPTPPKAAPTPPKVPPPQSTQTKAVPPETDAESKRVRRVSLSSSSDGSRSSSPDGDPLSLFKDVVHIQAADDGYSVANKATPAKSIPKTDVTSQKPKPTDARMMGCTSITKSHAEPKKADFIIKKNPGVTSSAKSGYHIVKTTPNTRKFPPKNKSDSQVAMMKEISKTDSILKKLDKSTPPIPPKKAPQETVDLIDLDDLYYPSTSKTSAKTRSQVATAPSREAPKQTLKVTGTSKNIIIGLSGKTPTLTTTNSGGKRGPEKPAPVAHKPRIDLKKRAAPAPDTRALKKSKTEPMSLKDFNLDDIDDIIELE